MNVQAKANVSRHLALLVTLFVLIFAPPRAQSVEPTTRLTQLAHRAWRTGDAGLMGTPQGLTQTTDGYIWVSTENGLYRFDGMQFTKWIPLAGESLPSISLWHLLGTRDGSPLCEHRSGSHEDQRWPRLHVSRKPALAGSIR